MVQKNAIAIAGIHTGIGKTIASAVITQALDADYWKPVQAGIEERDSNTVAQLLTNGSNRVHAEAVLLANAMSPHAAAEIEQVTIDYTTFKWPDTHNLLIVETAGGLLSPMSGTSTMADFITYYNLPVLLVAQNYLGSINHTLLTIEVLRNRKIKILGIIMNGPENKQSEDFIERYAQASVIARIPFFNALEATPIKESAMQIKDALLNSLNR